MHIPAHINKQDKSKEAMQKRAMHAQSMLELSKNGNGFRHIPELSNQVSIVEKYLIAAGEMEPLQKVPNNRRYRQARRKHNDAFGKAQSTVKIRHLSIEPSDTIINQVLNAYKHTKNPAEFVMAFITHKGILSLAEYDKLATRVERFMHSIKNNPNKRIPTHIRNMYIIKQVIEQVLAQRWPATSATQV